MSSLNQNLPLPSGFQLEEYRIIEALSHGGFSIVYLAEDSQHRQVAIKEYLPGFIPLRCGPDPEPQVQPTTQSAFVHGMHSFFEEGRVLAKLKHPNVVHVMNFFRANGTAYLVMEFEHGRTLQQHIAKHAGGIRESFIRSIFSRLLNGLREVHSHKLLHLDIKPANIYLRIDGSPVLLDFGAVRQVIGDSAPALRAVHTPGYSAPEQHLKNQPLGPWTDIYALGASMYTCMSGKMPMSALVRSVQDTLPPAQEAFAGRYTQQLLEIVDACMRIDPDERPASLLQLQKQLSEVTDLPPEPGPEQPTNPNLLDRFTSIFTRR